MVRNPYKVISERRDQVWYLMLKGHSPQSIKKTLNMTNATIYRDIKFLTTKSKQYVYDMARGTHVLLYQRAIEGIGLTLSEAWKKFQDPEIPEKQELGYLRLTRECNESMIGLTPNGPNVLSINHLADKVKRLGILELEPKIVSEKEEIDNYMNSYKQSK